MLNTLSVLKTSFLCSSPLSPHNQFQELACCFLSSTRPLVQHEGKRTPNDLFQQASSVSSMQSCGVGNCGVPMCKRGINQRDLISSTPNTQCISMIVSQCILTLLHCMCKFPCVARIVACCGVVEMMRGIAQCFPTSTSECTDGHCSFI